MQNYSDTIVEENFKSRTEHDSMGEIQVPLARYWSAQTERSRNNFKIGPHASMPAEIIEAFGFLKKAAAFANYVEISLLVINSFRNLRSVCFGLY